MERAEALTAVLKRTDEGKRPPGLGQRRCAGHDRLNKSLGVANRRNITAREVDTRMRKKTLFISAPGALEGYPISGDTLIRRATAHDVDRLAAMACRTFEDAFGPQNDPDDMARYLETAFTPEKIADELKDPAALFLLVVKNDVFQGYAKLFAGPAPECVNLPKPLQLVRLYVNQESIGKALGAALMQICLDTAIRAGYGAIWLSVWEQNRRAIDFYLKWRFHKIGTYDFVIGRDIQTDWIMARSVAPVL